MKPVRRQESGRFSGHAAEIKRFYPCFEQGKTALAAPTGIDRVAARSIRPHAACGARWLHRQSESARKVERSFRKSDKMALRGGEQCERTDFGSAADAGLH